jgi:HPt (histidine-containing phosphotransfer) domain-containing protein
MLEKSDISTKAHFQPSSAQPVDLIHLARQTMNDAVLEREVLELFVRQSGLYVQRFKESQQENERKQAAHTIKGSARGIGAWDVAEKATLLEESPFSDTAFLHLDAAIQEANSYIHSLIRA